MPEREDVKNREDWAAVVALFRMLRGWSQTRLAEAAGMDKSRISRYESGDEVPRRATVERLATAAGVPIPLIEPIRWFLRSLREAMEEGAPATPAGRAPSGAPGGLQRRVEGAVERSVRLARAELDLLGRERGAD